MKPVPINGLHPEHVRLMSDGIAYRLGNGDINLDEAQAMMDLITPDPDNHSYVRNDECGCESNIVHNSLIHLIRKEDFCSHVSK